MADLSSAKTLLDQMKLIAQQFFGFFPKDNIINYQGKNWIVTGQIDKATGDVILRSTTDGSTTLFNQMDFLYPNHTAAAAANGVNGATVGKNIVNATAAGSPPLSLATAVPAVMSVAPFAGKFIPGLGGAPKVAPAAPLTTNGTSLLVDPNQVQAALQNTQQNINSLTNQINSALGPNMTFDSLSSAQQLKLVTDNAQLLFSTPASTLVTQLDQLNKNIAALTSVGPPSVTQAIQLDAWKIQKDALMSKIGLNQELIQQPGTTMESFVSRQVTTYNNDVTQLAGLQNQVADLTSLQNSISFRTSVYSDAANKMADGVIQNIQSNPVNISAADAQGLVQAAQDAAAKGTLIPYQLNADNKVVSGNWDPNTNALDPNQSAAARDVILNQYHSNIVNGATSNLDAQITPAMQAQARQNAYDIHVAEGDTSIASPDAIKTTDPMYQASLNDQLALNAKTNVNNLFAANQLKEAQAYKSALHGAELKGGFDLVMAGVSAYGEERGIESMFRNGFSMGAFAAAAGGAFGVYNFLGMFHTLLATDSNHLFDMINHMHLFGFQFGGKLNSVLNFMSGWKGQALIIGAMILVGWLLSLHKTPPEQQAAEELNAEVNPMIWNANGNVVFLAGVAMTMFGITMGPNAPQNQMMTLTQAQAIQVLTAQGAASIPTDNSLYADVFVRQGAPGQPTQVEYFSPAGTDSKGNPILTATVQTLSPNFQFATSQPPTGYVPIFASGPGGKLTINQQVVMGGSGSSASGGSSPAISSQMAQMLIKQQHLLQVANGVWVSPQTQVGSAYAAGSAAHDKGN